MYRRNWTGPFENGRTRNNWGGGAIVSKNHFHRMTYQWQLPRTPTSKYWLKDRSWKQILMIWKMVRLEEVQWIFLMKVTLNGKRFFEVRRIHILWVWRRSLQLLWIVYWILWWHCIIGIDLFIDLLIGIIPAIIDIIYYIHVRCKYEYANQSQIVYCSNKLGYITL